MYVLSICIYIFIHIFLCPQADVVSQTRIRYNKTQLLHLIQMHLLQEGYEDVATALRQAANLPQPPPPLPPATVTAMGPPRSLATPPPPSRAVSSTCMPTHTTMFPKLFLMGKYI